jgi:hypothetical protein
MRWIDQYTYWGLDRRRRGAGRFWERRKNQDAAQTPLSLATALRQLQARSWDAAHPDRVSEFCERCGELALLARENDEPAVADCLEAVASSLRAHQNDVETAQAVIDQGVSQARSVVGQR